MVDIASKSYQDGMYNYIERLEGHVPYFYIDTGKYGGSLTAGTGIAIYNRADKYYSSHAGYITDSLSGDNLSVANQFLNEYKEFVSFVSDYNALRKDLGQPPLDLGMNNSAEYEGSTLQTLLESKFTVEGRTLQFGDYAASWVLVPTGIRNSDGTVTAIPNDLISQPAGQSAMQKWMAANNVEKNIPGLDRGRTKVSD